MGVYLEIMIPYCRIGREGIRLGAGFMQRSREGIETKFWRPIQPHDGITDRHDNIIPVAIAEVVSKHRTSGMSITIHDDVTDPYKQLVRMKLSDLDDLEFEINKAYVFE